MRTDDLVVALAGGVQAVDARAQRRRHTFAVAGASGVAFVLMAYWLGVRPDLGENLDLLMFWLKELFCVALAAGGLLAVARLARPGVPLAWAPALIAVPFLAMWTLAVVELAIAAPAERADLLLGVSWTECPYNIVTLSLPFFVAVVWVMRGMAPTRLRLAGAAAGFASGALGALVYSLHCPELAAPFLGVWYALGMLIPAAAGALLGPRLLRW